MATKKSAGSSRNGRDSKSKRLGVKKFNNSVVRAGNILIRQRGLKQKLKTNSFIGVGKDHTLYALQSGHLSLKTNLKILVKKKNNFWFKRKSNSTQIDKFMFIWCNQISKKKILIMTKNSFLKNLINFGIYLGHKQIKSNTTMSIYIYGVYKNIHLINLEKTLIKLYNALALIKLIKEEKNPVLFVSSDPDRYVKTLIKSLAKHTNQAYIVNKWIPGLLTNWKQTKLSISQFKLLKNSLLSKSNTIIKNKYNKLKISLEGLTKLNKLPSLIISFSPNQDQLALKEAKIKNIPVIAITDTNAKPLSIDYPIPGNDDSKKALILYINLFERAFNEKSLK